VPFMFRGTMRLGIRPETQLAFLKADSEGDI
jgi:hypothetical protein